MKIIRKSLLALLLGLSLTACGISRNKINKYYIYRQ